jgi:hypothetical protein
MITKNGITLKPPLLYIDEKSKPFSEVYSLINSLTEYFNQTDVIYDAELSVSNNDWEDVPGLPGCRKRQDITFSLNELTEIHVKPDKIIFKLTQDEHSINLSKDFFYSIEYEEAYYD